MLKIELVWRELLFRSIEKKKPDFTLTELADKFQMSVSVVSHALYPLRQMHMIEVAKTKSKVVDAEKLLLYWATRRNLPKDIIYQTNSRFPVREIETSMPFGVFPTAYSAARLYIPGIAMPADYDHCYFYAENIDEIKIRFPPESKKASNIFLLAQDPFLKMYGKTPLAQVFADLWNLPEWYAKEFNDEVLMIIRENLGL